MRDVQFSPKQQAKLDAYKNDLAFKAAKNDIRAQYQPLSIFNNYNQPYGMMPQYGMQNANPMADMMNMFMQMFQMQMMCKMMGFDFDMKGMMKEMFPNAIKADEKKADAATKTDVKKADPAKADVKTDAVKTASDPAKAAEVKAVPLVTYKDTPAYKAYQQKIAQEEVAYDQANEEASLKKQKSTYIAPQPTQAEIAQMKIEYETAQKAAEEKIQQSKPYN